MESPMQTAKVTSNSIISNNYHIHLYGEIGDPSEHIEELATLYNATENDQIDIFINSSGGLVYTAIQLVDAIRNCRANVVGHLVGAAYSCATNVFLACDYWRIADHSMLMFHNASVGPWGKMHEVEAYWEHSKSTLKDLVVESYKNFLTEDEISRILDGKDIYLKSDEIAGRLEIFAEARAAELEESVEDGLESDESEQEEKE